MASGEFRQLDLRIQNVRRLILDKFLRARRGQALIAGVTDLLVQVLAKNPATTFVLIDEVEMEDWGIGGLPVEDYRQKLRTGG